MSQLVGVPDPAIACTRPSEICREEGAHVGWSYTYNAEYVALTQLQADALVIRDATLARSVKGIVATASIDALRWQTQRPPSTKAIPRWRQVGEEAFGHGELGIETDEIGGGHLLALSEPELVVERFDAYRTQRSMR